MQQRKLILFVAGTFAFSLSLSIPQRARSDEVELLSELLLSVGVSGREEAVREVILDNLPAWARREAVVDAIGNVSVTVGSGEPWVMYVAHMDETGYMVTHIRDDGLLQVHKHGGFYDRQYEGHVVQIHTSAGLVHGVVILPSTHLRSGANDGVGDFTAEDVLIDVGTASREETEALGIELLDTITVPKTVTQLAGTRIAARSLDDRFGCAAILEVAGRVRPGDITGTVTFAWTVQEEVGLRGATALAAEMSPDVVVPVDTYVTSDSALEDPRIGYAELGGGPVIRALDNSNIAPIGTVRSLMAFAERRELPLRYGATGGGNDGSVFRNARSSVLPLGIPIRYSHSAVETIDTVDLNGLTNLIEAMVRDVSWVPEP